MKKIVRNYETYALITGAASGMGRIYALRLASMGYNLVLVDINAAGLEETSRMVSESSSRSKVHVFVQDLSLMDAADNIRPGVTSAVNSAHR